MASLRKVAREAFSFAVPGSYAPALLIFSIYSVAPAKNSGTFAKNFKLMNMKISFLVPFFALTIFSCKTGPDQALISQMQADIDKYEPHISALQQFGTEMYEMGSVMLTLPDDVKKNIRMYNTEEAEQWQKVGSKMQNGFGAYTQKLDEQKTLLADYTAGKIPKESAEAKSREFALSLSKLPQQDLMNNELNSARESYRQMIAVVPDSLLAEVKKNILKIKR